jgi:hypothetical protein
MIYRLSRRGERLIVPICPKIGSVFGVIFIKDARLKDECQENSYHISPKARGVSGAITGKIAK